MSKNKTISGIIILLVVLIIGISTFLVISYATGVLSAAVAFASTSQITKLQACGMTAPPELVKLRTDIPDLILPVIYVGLPSILIVISILMFLAGRYYNTN